MIKNDFNDRLSNEFLVSIEDLHKNKEKYSMEIEAMYKKYLNFDSKFLRNMPLDEIESFFVHPRIKDYSKVCILGILFIDQWIEGETEEDDSFYKLEKGATILFDVYLNGKESKLDYYIDYLIKACDILVQYEIPVGMKMRILEVYFKNNDFIKVDDMAFEILEDDLSYKEKVLDVYKKMSNLPNGVLEKNDILKEEVEEAMKDIINNFN